MRVKLTLENTGKGDDLCDLIAAVEELRALADRANELTSYLQCYSYVGAVAEFGIKKESLPSSDAGTSETQKTSEK